MSEAQREMVIRLHRSGVPSSQIARRVRVTRREVNEVIRESVLRGRR